MALIEYDVPLSGRPRNAGPIMQTLRALKSAEVGASVFFAGTSPESIRGAIQRLGSRWAACRKVDGGYRVWRIA